MKLGLLGAGKMATAITAGMLDADLLKPEDVVACDISAEARSAFTGVTGADCVDFSRDALAGCDVLLLAVKPQVAQAAVAALGAVGPGTLVVSIAAGIPLRRLAEWFGSDRIIRVMPNTPLMVGLGAGAFSRGAAASDEDAELVRSIFGTLGIIVEVEEGLLDAVTALSGSGPAYVFEFIRALTAAGEHIGLTPETALSLTVQTVLGAGEMVRRQLGTPAELRDAVTSKGGTTAAALGVLRDARFEDLISRALTAARDRSRELGSLS